MVKTTKVTSKRGGDTAPTRRAVQGNHPGTDDVLVRGAAGGTPKIVDTGGTKKAPGQGKGPNLVGMDNEVSSAVPSRLLTTHVVRRASHNDATLKPGRLVDYSRSLGK